ncbi:MAG: hypothetical protein OEX18_06525 [Candidatus Krumholzibacteria bacterium]|nr:hypothetical protein [Candidatus Krumholzibacteria bacterium]MDH4336920.1 hypothetical protein [Candidatus Krumholzibacteria bacterium]MDH5269784.1 hypothetical protein [Candidatus Krumholzibacteria bacterium]
MPFKISRLFLAVVFTIAAAGWWWGAEERVGGTILASIWTLVAALYWLGYAMEVRKHRAK